MNAHTNHSVGVALWHEIKGIAVIDTVSCYIRKTTKHLFKAYVCRYMQAITLWSYTIYIYIYIYITMTCRN